MPTGLPSNIDVIDEDPRNGGNLDTLGPLPMDVVARTRNKGRHVFTKHRPGNKSGELADGIDLKSEGGYVILWPHSDEGQWEAGDLTTPLPGFPDRLLKKRGTTLRGSGVDLARTKFPTANATPTCSVACARCAN